MYYYYYYNEAPRMYIPNGTNDVEAVATAARTANCVNTAQTVNCK